MVNQMYSKGYNVGFKHGVISGLKGSNARAVMEHDLEYVYGILCLVLKRRHGWKNESIQKLVSEIQNCWANGYDESYECRERMSVTVERETGVQLQQVVDTAIEAGNAEYMRADNDK